MAGGPHCMYTYSLPEEFSTRILDPTTFYRWSFFPGALLGCTCVPHLHVELGLERVLCNLRKTPLFIFLIGNMQWCMFSVQGIWILM